MVEYSKDSITSASSNSTSTSTLSGGDQPKPKTQKINLEDFEIKRTLGEGAYGVVQLAIEKKTDRKVAIKSVQQEQIIRLNKQKHIMREKELLDEMNHPLII